MKLRVVFFISLLMILMAFPWVLFGQEVQPLAGLDAVTVKLAGQIGPKLSGKVMVGIFSRGEQESPLGRYWRENLMAELSNVPGRTFTLLGPGSQSQPDYTIGGEITEVGNTIRVYTRLLNNSEGAIMATWYSDVQRDDFVDDLLGPAAAAGVSSVRRDQYEPDSMANPMAAAIGAPPVSRTIHSNDQDWFKVVSAETRQLSAETGGSMDTFMELYDKATGNKLRENDDGGSGTNARIRWNAEAGKEYVLMVRGYSGETGSYTFRVESFSIPDEAWEPNDSRDTATPLTLGSSPLVVNATLAASDDIDWYRVEIPAGGGSITVYTEGDTDTLLALVDADGQDLDEDDDSGSSYNAKITRQISGGTLFIKVSCYDEGGPYSLHIQLPR
jgi:hypothetical protein